MRLWTLEVCLWGFAGVSPVRCSDYGRFKSVIAKGRDLEKRSCISAPSPYIVWISTSNGTFEIMLGDKRAVRLLEHGAVSIIGQYKCWPTQGVRTERIVSLMNGITCYLSPRIMLGVCCFVEIKRFAKRTVPLNSLLKSCCRQREQGRSLLTILPSIGENSSIPVI